MYTAIYFIGAIMFSISLGYELESIPIAFNMLGICLILYALVAGAVALGKKHSN